MLTLYSRNDECANKDAIVISNDSDIGVLLQLNLYISPWFCREVRLPAASFPPH